MHETCVFYEVEFGSVTDCFHPAKTDMLKSLATPSPCASVMALGMGWVVVSKGKGLGDRSDSVFYWLLLEWQGHSQKERQKDL